MQLPGCLDEFGAGIFLARMLDARAGKGRPWTGYAWLLGAVVAGTVTFAIYWRYTSYWDLPLMVTFWRTSLGVFFLCVVAAAVHLPPIAATRALRPLAYLGVVSYGIYLWHLFAIRYALTIPDLTSPQLLLVSLAVTLALAMLSWHLFERPILAYGRRYDGRGRLWRRAASAGNR